MTDLAFACHYGETHPQQVLILEPLFEEANRCRRLIATMMRHLDKVGIGSAIVTLPGTGESLRPLVDISFSDWASHVAELKADAVASLRGGALLDAAINAPCHWRFAPETGSRIVRDLRRTALTTGNSQLYAGHKISDAMMAALESAKPDAPQRLRTVRLESDATTADAKLAGSPLWRRAEPGDDPALAALLAADLTDWIKQCAAS